MEDRKERLAMIAVIIQRLQAEVNELVAERHDLMLAQAKEEHPCPCVKQNGDIGVFDMQDQEAARRNALGLGMVSQTLSSSKDCLFCKGTGIPNTERHNHFGEAYHPTTCPGCMTLERKKRT